LIAAALFAVLPIGLAWSQSDPVIAKVNGVDVRESDLAMDEEDVGQNQQLQTLTGDARRDYLVSYLADVILAAKAAEGKKVADQKDFKSRLAFIRNKLLMETLLQQEGKAALTPDLELQRYLEQLIIRIDLFKQRAHPHVRRAHNQLEPERNRRDRSRRGHEGVAANHRDADPGAWRPRHIHAIAAAQGPDELHIDMKGIPSGGMDRAT